MDELGGDVVAEGGNAGEWEESFGDRGCAGIAGKGNREGGGVGKEEIRGT